MRVDLCRDLIACHRTNIDVTSVLHLCCLNDELMCRSRLIWQIASLLFTVEDFKCGRSQIVFLEDYKVFVPKARQVRIVLVVYPLFDI